MNAKNSRAKTAAAKTRRAAAPARPAPEPPQEGSKCPRCGGSMEPFPLPDGTREHHGLIVMPEEVGAVCPGPPRAQSRAPRG